MTVGPSPSTSSQHPSPANRRGADTHTHTDTRTREETHRRTPPGPGLCRFEMSLESVSSPLLFGCRPLPFYHPSIAPCLPPSSTKNKRAEADPRCVMVVICAGTADRLCVLRMSGRWCAHASPSWRLGVVAVAVVLAGGCVGGDLPLSLSTPGYQLPSDSLPTTHGCNYTTAIRSACPIH